MPMNTEIKAKWLTALRSGKYAQSAGCLKQTSGYCCLGVLVECVKGKEIFKPDLNPRYFTLKEYGFQGTLPREYLKEFQLHQSDQETLAIMNDQSKKSFLDIADYIEANL